MSVATAWMAAMTIATVYIAMSQPWLGIGLAADEDASAIRIVSIDKNGPAAGIKAGSILHSVGELELEVSDLVEEPDTLATYLDFQRVLHRQGLLFETLRSPSAKLVWGEERDSSLVVPAETRPIGSLPFAFWSQLFAGASGFLIGAWVFSLRSRELSGWLMAVVGACLPIMIFTAAIYSTRELALDPILFRWLAATDHFGAIGVATGLVALFYVYPNRLAPNGALVCLGAVNAVWWLADTLWIGFEGSPHGFHLAVLVLMMLFVPAAVLQYRLTKNDPAKRAALRWFALSVGLGTGAFVVLIILPNLLGSQSLTAQAHAFLLFVFIFGGVALGVARFRLFELEQWAFGVLFYAAGALLLVVLDALLIFVLSLDHAPALGVSLMAVALLYLPVRDWLHHRIVGRPADHGALFQQTVDVALTPPGADQNMRWANLLKQAYNPLQIAPANHNATSPMQPEIQDDGLTLALPAVENIRAVTLGYAHAGRKLFSRDDAKLAGELCTMLQHAISSRRSREDGVADERARISRDMHDNIGAKLLSALHSPDNGRRDVMIREALTDLRDIINNSASDSPSLDEMLADLRLETVERCEAAGVEMAWATAAAADGSLPPRAAHAVRSIVREAVSNIIRHAGASAANVVVNCDAKGLNFEISDNGRGIQLTGNGGNGIVNMKGRLDALGGSLDILDANPGTRLRASIPF